MPDTDPSTVPRTALSDLTTNVAEAHGWRAAASQFRGDHLSKEAAGYLADHLSDAAAAVRNADLRSMRDEAESFAR